MSAAIELFPTVPRPMFGCPDWREQFEREHLARLAMVAPPPPRTRPLLVIDNVREARRIDRDNYAALLASIERFMNEGRGDN
jgi:hypothetical protein